MWMEKSVSEIRDMLDQWGVLFSRAKHTAWIRVGNCGKANTHKRQPMILIIHKHRLSSESGSALTRDHSYSRVRAVADCCLLSTLMVRIFVLYVYILVLNLSRLYVPTRLFNFSCSFEIYSDLIILHIHILLLINIISKYIYHI